MSTPRIRQLVRMAEHIVINLGGQRDPEGAVRRAADHLRRFWTLEMLAGLRACGRDSGQELSPLLLQVLAALEDA